MSTASVIHLAGHTKSYDDIEVLRGVDLDVTDGSILALLEPIDSPQPGYRTTPATERSSNVQDLTASHRQSKR